MNLVNKIYKISRRRRRNFFLLASHLSPLTSHLAALRLQRYAKKPTYANLLCIFIVFCLFACYFQKNVITLHFVFVHTTMKKFSFLLFLFLLASSMAHAVTYVYKGRSTYSSDILFTWDGKYLYAGRSTYSSDVILTFDGKYIYAGRSTYSSDILGTWDGQYFYDDRSTYSSDILCTWDGKYVYKGRSTYSSDVLYTYDRQYVYSGRSTYSSDIILTVEGSLPIAVLIVIVL